MLFFFCTGLPAFYKASQFSFSRICLGIRRVTCLVHTGVIVHETQRQYLYKGKKNTVVFLKCFIVINCLSGSNMNSYSGICSKSISTDPVVSIMSSARRRELLRSPFCRLLRTKAQNRISIDTDSPQMLTIYPIFGLSVSDPAKLQLADVFRHFMQKLAYMPSSMQDRGHSNGFLFPQISPRLFRLHLSKSLSSVSGWIRQRDTTSLFSSRINESVCLFMYQAVSINPTFHSFSRLRFPLIHSASTHAHTQVVRHYFAGLRLQDVSLAF